MKNMFIFKYMFLLLFAVFFIPSVSSASFIYVDNENPQASDSNPGAEDLPFLTIQKAVNTVEAGDTVVVKQGTYNERVVLPKNVSGTSVQKITIKAEPRRSVLMQGFKNFEADYVRIEGFNITSNSTGWDKKQGVYFKNVIGSEIVDNYIYDMRDFGIIGGTNSYVSNNYVVKSAYGISIGSNSIMENNEVERLYRWLDTGDNDFSRFFGDNIIIRNNYFHGTISSEVPKAHVDCFQTFDNNGLSIHNVLIEKNTCIGYFSQGVIAQAKYYDNSSGMIIRNNIFAKASSWGVILNNVKNVSIYNNVFDITGVHGTGFKYNSTGGVVKNNIFYNSQTTYFGSDVIGSNNIFYNNSIYDITPEKYPNDIFVDPLFVDPENNDFRLQPGSPAIDAGADLSTIFTDDINGNSRPQGSGWDVGPYEYTTVAPTTTPSPPTPTPNPAPPPPAPPTPAPIPQPPVNTKPAPPSVPVFTSSIPISKTEIELKWSDSGTSYMLYRNGNFLKTVKTNMYTDGGLRENTEYTYTLRAENSGGISELSETISVKTKTTKQSNTSGEKTQENPTYSSDVPQSKDETQSQVSNTSNIPILTGPFSIGMSSSQVITLQKYLAKDSSLYSEGIVSGYYGIFTRRAVERFQCTYMEICGGAPSTTGYGLAGPKTREKIMEVLGSTSITKQTRDAVDTDNQNLFDELEVQIQALQEMVAELLKELEMLLKEQI